MPLLVPGLAGTLLVLVLCVYGLGTLSASVPRWCVVYLAAGLCLLAFAVRVWRRPLALSTVDAAALSLFGYMALSLLWSPDWREGAYQLVNTFGVLCIFLWVRNAPQFHVKWLSGAAVVGLYFMFLQELRWPMDYGGHGNRNFQTEAMLGAFAIALLVKERGARMAVLLCGLAPLTFLVIHNESKVELFVALVLLIAWGVICGSRRLRIRSARGLSYGSTP